MRKILATGTFLWAQDTKRVLFLLRDEDTYTNTWGLVGGRVEKGESVTQGLRREIFEETGNDLKLLKTIPLELFRSDDNHFEYHTFVSVIENEFIPTLSSEHKGYCWCSMDCFPKPLHPGLWSSLSNQDIQDKLLTVKKMLETD